LQAVAVVRLRGGIGALDFNRICLQGFHSNRVCGQAGVESNRVLERDAMTGIGIDHRPGAGRPVAAARLP
jgi:hypothetical protein